jgi:FlgD Ig-like domain/Immune inhibitor A-like, MAM domain
LNNYSLIWHNSGYIEKTNQIKKKEYEMKKSLFVVVLTVFAIGLFAKGTCDAGIKSSVSAVFDADVLHKVESVTDEGKADAGLIENGSREWQNIKDESFEGAWPNEWNCYSNSTLDCYWSDDNNQSSSGSWSGWCADGGSDAPSEQIYPNNMNTWMIYGPFSLADAVDADMEFDLWYQTESGYDYVQVLASLNGVNYFGTQWDGDSNGWDYHNFDLTDVYEIGNLTGHNQVWIAFVFLSDVSNAYEGAYVDQINIDKDYDAPLYYGAPSIYSVSLENEIDANSNGFYEEFCFELDVDATSAAIDATYRAEDCYISVYRDDNGAFLGEWGPFCFSDMMTSDNVVVGPFYDLVGYNATDFSFTVYCDNYLGSDSATIVVDVEAGNVSNDDDLIAATTALVGNYPNPFNPTTSINYNLTENDEVSLKIYNVKGELVRTLVSNEQAAGNHSVIWNGRDDNGIQAGSGVFFYNLKTDKYSGTKRMIMLK